MINSVSESNYWSAIDQRTIRNRFEELFVMLRTTEIYEAIYIHGFTHQIIRKIKKIINSTQNMCILFRDYVNTYIFQSRGSLSHHKTTILQTQDRYKENILHQKFLISKIFAEKSRLHPTKCMFNNVFPDYPVSDNKHYNVTDSTSSYHKITTPRILLNTLPPLSQQKSKDYICLRYLSHHICWV